MEWGAADVTAYGQCQSHGLDPFTLHEGYHHRSDNASLPHGTVLQANVVTAKLVRNADYWTETAWRDVDCQQGRTVLDGVAINTDPHNNGSPPIVGAVVDPYAGASCDDGHALLSEVLTLPARPLTFTSHVVDRTSSVLSCDTLLPHADMRSASGSACYNDMLHVDQFGGPTGPMDDKDFEVFAAQLLVPDMPISPHGSTVDEEVHLKMHEINGVNDMPISHPTTRSGRPVRKPKPGVVVLPACKKSSLPKAKKSMSDPIENSSRSSTFRGVTKHRRSGRWEAHIWVKEIGRQVYLGGYENEDHAAEAYDVAALKCKGPKTKTNFDPSRYADLLPCMDSISLEELIMAVRRQSQGFSRGSSSFRGVTAHPSGRWESRIGIPGSRHIYLGLFEAEEEAAKAYDRALVRLRGTAAATNYGMQNYRLELSEYHQLQQVLLRKPNAAKFQADPEFEAWIKSGPPRDRPGSSACSGSTSRSSRYMGAHKGDVDTAMDTVDASAEDAAATPEHASPRLDADEDHTM